ncbi:hypothetical protein EFY87_02070 [Flexivirga caeni]|uniref:Uncharacterized protein n=1 Tax=Flexivirga caeni TaxID=2294115 RepID=A0A3M9MIM3_9MICO|nr:hypothetical protein EFY87_02070 [Flexivirga caeni]
MSVCSAADFAVLYAARASWMRVVASGVAELLPAVADVLDEVEGLGVDDEVAAALDVEERLAIAELLELELDPQAARVRPRAATAAAGATRVTVRMRPHAT